MLYVNFAVKCLKFDPKWPLPYFQPILVVIFVTIAAIQVELMSDVYTYKLIRRTNKLSLICFKVLATLPLSRYKYVDFCCELHLHCQNKPLNDIVIFSTPNRKVLMNKCQNDVTSLTRQNHIQYTWTNSFIYKFKNNK